MRARLAFSLGQPRTRLRFSLAIPLTRLRIVVPGREEERGHRRVSPSSPCQRLSAPRFRADVRVENAECGGIRKTWWYQQEWTQSESDAMLLISLLQLSRWCDRANVDLCTFGHRASGLVASKGRNFSVSDLNKSFHSARRSRRLIVRLLKAPGKAPWYLIEKRIRSVCAACSMYWICGYLFFFFYGSEQARNAEFTGTARKSVIIPSAEGEGGGR
jgi:hypothetical protein